jgi:NAD(P)-dependent dehydrogenase (short-subunit alcohol dehydrogenase family)
MRNSTRAADTPISFDEQVAIVTGAGKGLGQAYAEELARRGTRVVVNDVVTGEADAVVHAIQSAGGQAAASYDSVATPEGGRAIVATTVDRFGTVDAVVNNAGTFRHRYLEDLTVERVTDVIGVGLLGAFWVTQPAWAVMREKGYGRIVMISSSSGMFSHPGIANYAAAKAGIYGLTRALGAEGTPYGIRVNAILPSGLTQHNLGAPVVNGFPIERGGSPISRERSRDDASLNSSRPSSLTSRVANVP